MSLLENLQWRYATKKMNGQVVPQEKVDYIVEAARLAPSSSGIQPYRIFVISNKELQEKMKPICYDQTQVTDASHVLVFAAWDGYSLERIDQVFRRTVSERNQPEGKMDDYRDYILSLYTPLGTEWQAHHAAKQAYIAFGLAIAAAAEQQVDATPMEGFMADKMDELLGLSTFGLKSILILPLGYREEANDWLFSMKKVRTPKEEFVTYL